MADHDSWPSGLPRAGDAPVFLPPDPGPMVAAARRMRRTRAAMAGAGTAAVLAASVFGAVAAGIDRAGGADKVTPLVSTSPNPAKPHGNTTQAVTGPASRPAAGSKTGRIPSRGGATTTSGVGPATGSTGTTAPAMAPTATPLDRSVVPASPTSCAYQTVSAPSGWCLDYPGPTSAPAGQPVDMSVDACRIPGTGAGTLRFGTAKEADIWVGGGKQEWDWAHGRTFASTPHRVTVAAGECLRWTTTWTTKDDQGHYLPRGGYSLSVYVLSPDVDLPNSSTMTAVDFTLT